MLLAFLLKWVIDKGGVAVMLQYDKILLVNKRVQGLKHVIFSCTSFVAYNKKELTMATSLSP